MILFLIYCQQYHLTLINLGFITLWQAGSERSRDGKSRLDCRIVRWKIGSKEGPEKKLLSSFVTLDSAFKLPRKVLLNFVGYCDLASLKKVHPENKKLWPENTGQPKSARAFLLSTRPFLLSTPMENEKFSFSIGLDNKKP